MPFETYGTAIVVCGPPQGVYYRTVRECWTCGTRRRMVIRHMGVWYGINLYCLTCGDVWGEEGRYPRPFSRGWKREAVAKAKAMWETALTRAEYNAAVDRELALYV